jgi:hypothetical protein
MSTESHLREKLRKIEALFAGAGTVGERLAAEAALERVRARLTDIGRRDPPIEMQFTMPDTWSGHLFIALCRRYGLKPYRYRRQRPQHGDGAGAEPIHRSSSVAGVHGTRHRPAILSPRGDAARDPRGSLFRYQRGAGGIGARGAAAELRRELRLLRPRPHGARPSIPTAAVLVVG